MGVQIPPSAYQLNCSCPIHVEGSLAGEKVRRALDLTSWEAASDLIARWNASGQIGVSRAEVPTIKGHIATLAAQHHALPARVSVAEARHGEEPVKLSTEREHLTNVLKLVAFQIESDLVELIRPHYARTDEEGLTLVQTALQSAAAIEPTADDLHVTLAPLSSSHRSQAVAALCRTLNETATPFPGTMLRMRFAVAEA